MKVEDFAEVMFDSGDHTCFSDDPYGVMVYPMQRGIIVPSAYFSINAMLPHPHTRLDKNVIKLRSFLIECDEGTLEEQSAYIASLGMPYSACVFSGGKSLHYFIAMEELLPDRTAYDALARRIHQVVTKCDHKTKNPSRFARWPGHFRQDKQKWQKLLQVKHRINLKELEDWLSGNGASQDPRPVKTSTVNTDPDKFRLGPNDYTLQFLENGADLGERNNQLYLAAMDLKEKGWTLDEAIAALSNAPTDLPLRELTRTIESAYRKS